MGRDATRKKKRVRRKEGRRKLRNDKRQGQKVEKNIKNGKKKK